MSDFFRAFKAVGLSVPTYFIESTAPNNVDDEVASNASQMPAGLTQIDPANKAIEEIARALAEAERPNLVIMVHGYNNPRPAVLDFYDRAARTIEADYPIRSRRGLVCMGYRWPSERLGQPIRGSWRALPTLPIWVLYLGAAGALIFGIALFRSPPAPNGVLILHILALLGLIAAGLVVTAGLLRVIVYFRDVYRASNYGVPDLVQIIRTIDAEIVRVRGARPKSDTERRQMRAALGEREAAGAAGPKVELSFIGHSMGGFVVTNTIRTLSDLFADPPTSVDSFGLRAYRERRPGLEIGPETADAAKPASADIGNVMRLVRFVLASPDIPAEHLLSSRSNFLASSLVRFDEAYLFSNEGDEVLRQISTLANYFSYPTKSRKHGFRLGNVDILSSALGVIKPAAPGEFLSTVRIGNLTLQQLYAELDRAGMARDDDAGTPRPPRSAEEFAPLPKYFSYFDCTDYRDTPEGIGRDGPLLTFGKWPKERDPAAKLAWYSHLGLLAAYLIRQKPNVHGGYFDGLLARQLIFRLACLGYKDTLAAYGGAKKFSGTCADKRIRVLLSPRLP